MTREEFADGLFEALTGPLEFKAHEALARLRAEVEEATMNTNLGEGKTGTGLMGLRLGGVASLLMIESRDGSTVEIKVTKHP